MWPTGYFMIIMEVSISVVLILFVWHFLGNYHTMHFSPALCIIGPLLSFGFIQTEDKFPHISHVSKVVSQIHGNYETSILLHCGITEMIFVKKNDMNNFTDTPQNTTNFSFFIHIECIFTARTKTYLIHSCNERN